MIIITYTNNIKQMEHNIVIKVRIKLNIALQNIRCIATRVSLQLNGRARALGPVKYLGNPLGYIVDIIEGLFIVIIGWCRCIYFTHFI